MTLNVKSSSARVGSVIERYNDVIETMMICRGVSVAFRRYDIDP